MTKVTINLTVNGKALTAAVEPRWPLAEFLRDHLRPVTPVNAVRVRCMWTGSRCALARCLRCRPTVAM